MDSNSNTAHTQRRSRYAAGGWYDAAFRWWDSVRPHAHPTGLMGRTSGRCGFVHIGPFFLAYHRFVRFFFDFLTFSTFYSFAGRLRPRFAFSGTQGTPAPIACVTGHPCYAYGAFPLCGACGLCRWPISRFGRCTFYTTSILQMHIRCA